MPPLLELLETADSVPLLISGSSMAPFLVHHRDTVYLSKVCHPLQRGDMILYRRDSGKYVLHRIFRTESETYTLVGDPFGSPAPRIVETLLRSSQTVSIT